MNGIQGNFILSATVACLFALQLRKIPLVCIPIETTVELLRNMTIKTDTVKIITVFIERSDIKGYSTSFSGIKLIFCS